MENIYYHQKQHCQQTKLQSNTIPIIEMIFHKYADNNLPFVDCSPFVISQLFQTGKNQFIDKLENNNFTKEMLKHINEISEDNYSCKYYDENNFDPLVKSHDKNLH